MNICGVRRWAEGLPFPVNYVLCVCVHVCVFNKYQPKIHKNKNYLFSIKDLKFWIFLSFLSFNKGPKTWQKMPKIRSRNAMSRALLSTHISPLEVECLHLHSQELQRIWETMHTTYESDEIDPSKCNLPLTLNSLLSCINQESKAHYIIIQIPYLLPAQGRWYSKEDTTSPFAQWCADGEGWGQLDCLRLNMMLSTEKYYKKGVFWICKHWWNEKTLFVSNIDFPLGLDPRPFGCLEPPPLRLPPLRAITFAGTIWCPWNNSGICSTPPPPSSGCWPKIVPPKRKQTNVLSRQWFSSRRNAVRLNTLVTE